MSGVRQRSRNGLGMMRVIITQSKFTDLMKLTRNWCNKLLIPNAVYTSPRLRTLSRRCRPRLFIISRPSQTTPRRFNWKVFALISQITRHGRDLCHGGVHCLQIVELSGDDDAQHLQRTNFEEFFAPRYHQGDRPSEWRRRRRNATGNYSIKLLSDCVNNKLNR